MTKSCRICFSRQKISLGRAFASGFFGRWKVEDGIWLISFMSCDLGYVDLEQTTLQTIGNPFGTRL
ncbi:MAG: hypothetical protein JJ902_22795 [Roseibium sp.]|nr:hypothetical protein [Roseibium sp.]